MRNLLIGFLIHVVQLLAPVANAFAGTVTSTYVAMRDYKNMAFKLYWGVGATGTSTITVLAATDSSGTGATAIPFKYRRVSDTTASDVPGAVTDATASGFTTTAGSNQIYFIEVSADDMVELGDNYTWLAVRAVEVVASARLGGIDALFYDMRYAGATPKTVLA